MLVSNTSRPGLIGDCLFGMADQAGPDVTRFITTWLTSFERRTPWVGRTMEALLLCAFLMCFFYEFTFTHTADTQHDLAASLEMYVDRLPDPPKLYGYKVSSNGSLLAAHLHIGMYLKKWKFHRDLQATAVYAFGTSIEAASIPGPTIEAVEGVPTHVTWINQLRSPHILPWDRTVTTALPKYGGIPTVVHLHGGVNPPYSDGHPLAWFTAGFRERGPTWSRHVYTYPNAQTEGNLWYHDHTLGLTRVNILAGLLGAYVIRGPTCRLRTPPRFDRHLIIFDRSFNRDGSLFLNRTGDNPRIHPQWQPEYFGEAMIVNGKAWPYLEVERRRYRFRIINSSNARYLRLFFENGLKFVQIGSDASYLPRPVTTPSLLLAPAETADVFVDFSTAAARHCLLLNDAVYPYPSGDPPDELNGKVMKFIIDGEKSGGRNESRIPVIPKGLRPERVEKAGIMRRRYITLYEYSGVTGEPTHLYINGRRFEDKVSEIVRADGREELWEVINLTEDNHPLHIHLAKSQSVGVRRLVGVEEFEKCMREKKDAGSCNVSKHALGLKGDVVESERTWKNVVKIRPGCITSVVVRFEDFNRYPFDVAAHPGYVYHCHILDHEDNAMIRPLKIIRPPVP